MKTCGYCGKTNEPAAARCRECGTELPDAPAPPMPTTPEPVASSPQLPFFSATDLEPAFYFEAGFHRVDWDLVRRLIAAKLSPLDADAAWSEAALVWANKLRDDLGGDYRVRTSRQTILLCDLPSATAGWLLEYAGQTADRLQDWLGALAWQGVASKDVVLVFSDHDDYYEYLAHHSPDGEQAASGGVCIPSGYTHIALPWHDEFTGANTIVHELTHDCLAHLPLPLWLNEGVAVTVQRKFAPVALPSGFHATGGLYAAAIGWRPPIMWAELADDHCRFWDEQNIQSFWAGTSFYEPGDANQLSYSLAEVLVQLLSEQASARTFHAFLAAANHFDAGQTAAVDLLGADLGAVVETFLGPGDWRPQRKAMVACWKAAGWEEQ